MIKERVYSPIPSNEETGIKRKVITDIIEIQPYKDKKQLSNNKNLASDPYNTKFNQRSVILYTQV